MRLLELKAEQTSLEATLAKLQGELPALETLMPKPHFSKASVTNNSPASAKVAMFRRLFQGCTDVYPVRWENLKSSRPGYAACANEWRRGIRAKHAGPITLHFNDERIMIYLQFGFGGARCCGFIPPGKHACPW